MCLRHFQEIWQRAVSDLIGPPFSKTNAPVSLENLGDANSPKMTECVKNQRFIYSLRHDANLVGSTIPPVSHNPIDSSTMRKIGWKNRGDGTAPSYSGAHVGGISAVATTSDFNSAQIIWQA